MPPADTLAQIAARNMTSVVDPLCDHFGTGRGALCAALTGDTQLFKNAARAWAGGPAFVFTSRRYDRAMARLSAIWPDNLIWPVDVPRPSPELAGWERETEVEARAALRAMIARKKIQSEQKGNRADGPTA